MNWQILTSNHSRYGRGVVSVSLSSSDTNNTNNELEGDHARSSNQKNGTAPKTFDSPESERGS